MDENNVRVTNEEQIVLENEHVACTFDLVAGGFSRIALRDNGSEHEIIDSTLPVLPVFRLNWDAPTQQPPPKSKALRNIGATAKLQLISYNASEQSIEVEYAVDDEGHQAAVTVLIQLAAGRNELKVSGTVTNRTPDATISEVILPVVSNTRLADPTDETLYYPFFSGVRLEQPRRAILKGRTDALAASPLTPTYDASGGGMVRHLYCGRLSMPWLTVTGDGRGLALTHYDPTYEVSAFSVYAPSADPDTSDAAPVLDLSVAKVRPIAYSKTRSIPPTGVSVYAGTWHHVADTYRTWTQAQRFLPPRVPEWVRESHALTAHYDFKWEDGTFVHTFADIPELYRRTASEGINHIFMAGWFTGGFDHMYPEFFPDLQLGTVMDFIDAVRTVRDEGGRATFYINASLFGRASQYHGSLGMDWAVKDPEGETVDRRFFGRDFTVSCRGSKGYQQVMRDTVRWLVGEVGASGVYLDTFAAMGPHLCFDASHGHPHPAHWNRDSIATLRAVEDGVRQSNPEAFTMFEGCGDLYGQWIVAHLVHGWAYPNSHPEMFRYTFPDYVLVDMVYPTKGQSFRPAHVSRQAYEQLHRTFINGCIMWFYDQEDERFCNFRTDPDMWDYIKRLIAVREHGKRYFAYGRFMDHRQLQFDTEELDVKRYVATHAPDKFAADDVEMFVVWNHSGEDAQFTVTRALLEAWGQPVDSLQFDGYGVQGELRIDTRETAEGVQLTVPDTEIVVVFVRKA